MISSLKGKVSHAGLNWVVVEIGGFGIHLNVTVPFASALRVGQEVSIATHLVVREDALTLYGFENIEGKEVFELLMKVSGIGPKVALSALSIYQPSEILQLISGGESSALEKIPGLGKKGVARVVLELKDKVNSQLGGVGSANSSSKIAYTDEIKSALINLGYSAKDSENAVDQWLKSNPDTSQLPLSDMLKSILQMLGGHRR